MEVDNDNNVTMTETVLDPSAGLIESILNDPERFGPRLWCIIHLEAKRLDNCMSLRTRSEELRDDKDLVQHSYNLHHFLRSLDSFIPCYSCAQNYLKFFFACIKPK
jgi:hypothetical protein